MKTLELKHVAELLPYGLKMQSIRKNDNKVIISKLTISNYYFLIIIKKAKAKPILLPLSDWKNYKDELSDNAIEWFEYMFDYNIDCIDSLSYKDIKVLLSQKIDIHGLIDAGLAVDVNTLDFNPYK